VLLLACAAVVLLALPATAAENLDTLIEQWVTAYNAGDDAAVAAIYLEDGCRMPPHAEMVHGRQAIEGNIAGGREMGLAKVEIDYTGKGTSGDIGYGMGTWRAFDAEGNEVDHGKWMNHVKKVGDSWMIACDIWNSDLPMPGAEGAADE
jgi:ketosteroid isomerase-like protein